MRRYRLILLAAAASLLGSSIPAAAHYLVPDVEEPVLCAVSEVDPTGIVDPDGDCHPIENRDIDRILANVKFDPDRCHGYDDHEDENHNNKPDACEDADGDGVRDDLDVCPGADDTVDTDGDGTPDGCEDDDGDGVLNKDDACQGFDDNLDTDGDGAPDGCDSCPGFDDNADLDGDGVADGCDPDIDGDGVPNDLDDFPFDPRYSSDLDGDGVPDEEDQCHGHDDNVDTDGDAVPDGCDVFPNDPTRSTIDQAEDVYQAVARMGTVDDPGQQAGWETRVDDFTGGGNVKDMDRVWANGGSVHLRFEFDEATGVLTYTVGSKVHQRNVATVRDVVALRLDLKADGEFPPQSISLSNMTLNGQATNPTSVGVSQGAGDPGDYETLGFMIPSSATSWAFEADVTLSWGGSKRPNSDHLRVRMTAGA